MNTQQIDAQVREGQGFIAALDQSGGSTPKALARYGVSEDQWSCDDEMFDLIHRMRCRIISSPAFGGGKVLGAILFERTMDGHVDGTPVPQALLDRGVIPFLKVDRGLQDERDGVQLMNPIPDLGALLGRARVLGVHGTKMRSVIKSDNRTGIEKLVAQQFEVANGIADAGLMPILEPEYDIRARDRADGEPFLRGCLLDQLARLPGHRQVMLKLSLPVTPGLYRVLVDHPNVARVVALSGGYTRAEACRELARNPGMIASFSRALLSDLRTSMTDEEFDAALAEAIDDIHEAGSPSLPRSPAR